MKLKIVLALILSLAVVYACTTPSPTQFESQVPLARSSSSTPLYIGDAGWHLPARLDSTEVLTYLDTRQSQGFNAILMQLMVSDFYAGHVGVDTNAYGYPAFNDFNDWSTPNTNYWEYTDWVVDQASSRGFYLFITPAYVGYNCNGSGWHAEMLAQSDSDMTAWGTWLANRYPSASYPNIIWVGGGDWDIDVTSTAQFPNNCPTPSTLNSRMNAMMNAIAANSSNLITAHSYRSIHTGQTWRLDSSGYEGYPEPWLTMNSSYSRESNIAYEAWRVYQDQPQFDTVNIEAVYEQENYSECGTPIRIRSQLYHSILALNIGHIYGAGPSNPTGSCAPGPQNASYALWDFTPGWQSNMSMEGAEDLIHGRDLFLTRDYGNYQRIDTSIQTSRVYSALSDINTSSSYVGAVNNISDTTTIAYVPQDIPSVVVTSMPYQHKFWWYNPRTGQVIAAGTYYATANPRTMTKPTSGEDWVLVIDKTATWACPPGQYTCGPGGGGKDPIPTGSQPNTTQQGSENEI